MRLSVKHLRTCPDNPNHEVVAPGVKFGFWRVCEHVGRYWFPWPELYHTKERAEAARAEALRKGSP